MSARVANRKIGGLGQRSSTPVSFHVSPSLLFFPMSPSSLAFLAEVRSAVHANANAVSAG